MLKVLGSPFRKITFLLCETFEFCEVTKPHLSSGLLRYINAGKSIYYHPDHQIIKPNDKILKLWLSILPSIRLNSLQVKKHLPIYSIGRVNSYTVDENNCFKRIDLFKALGRIYYNNNLSGSTLIDSIVFPILKNLINNRNLQIDTPFSKTVCKRIQMMLGERLNIEFVPKP